MSNIFEESRGNLKDSLRPRFSICQNLEIWQSILHYLMPQIWWCIHIFHLRFIFFGHFSKWDVGVNIQWVSSGFHTFRCHDCDGDFRSSSRATHSSVIFNVRYMMCWFHVLLCLFAMKCIVMYKSLLMFYVGSCFILDVRCTFYPGVVLCLRSLFFLVGRILIVTCMFSEIPFFSMLEGHS